MKAGLLCLFFSLCWGACTPSDAVQSSISAQVEFSERAPVQEQPSASSPKPKIIMAPHILEGELSTYVKHMRDAALAKERELVVYVGATWCEPCRRFHDALEAGALDQVFPRVSFLEFDHDLHQAGLKKAGYLKRFVPLFALPKADGRASEHLHQGAIKGPGAVAFLRPKIEALFEARESQP